MTFLKHISAYPIDLSLFSYSACIPYFEWQGMAFLLTEIIDLIREIFCKT